MNLRRPTRREFLRLGAALALAPGVVLPAGAAADPSRIALVVGNDAYPGAPLGNAVNDAKAMAGLLERAGFGVDLRTNADRVTLFDATKRFAESAQRSEAKLVFFYYAGHGAQLDWRNYLLPVDALVNTAADLPAQCLDLASLLTGLAQAKGRTFVIVLDACRDNPFGGAFRPAQKGLSQFDAPPGSLLAFSTAPGSVAADATGIGGRSGLYAEHLVRELGVPATRLEDALKRVRLAVRVASKGAQVPWESTSLESDVFLFPTAKKLTETEIEAEVQRDLEAWNRVKGSKRTDDWIAYLREYPSGRFAEIAQTRLAYFVARDEAERASAQVAAVAPAPVTISPVPVPGAPAAVAAPAVVLAEWKRRDPAQLEIGPGHAPPVLMRPSANPNSAGTYPLDRNYSVGDVAVYSTYDPVYARATGREEHRVTRVDLDADRIEINDGQIVIDSMGNPLRLGTFTYDPRLQSSPAELQLGRRWTSRYRRTAGSAPPMEVYYDYQVAARERIRIAAGEFESFRIDGEGYNLQFGSQLLFVAWLVPGLNFALRTDWRRRDGRSLRVLDAEGRELVSCRQLRWTQA